MMLKVSISPLQFYQDEVAVPLTFVLRTLDGETVDTTYNTYSLIVAGHDDSPFELTPTGNPGEVEYVTEEGDFVTGGAPTKRYSAYIVQDADETYGDEVWFTDEFGIYVVLAPTENL